ncbi:MAG: helix-turn-helix transcriptional regulator [Myxococcales bacterium]|nr:helix-turn-helix transcriptional regulator [Myxococcales bacterium]
MPNTIAERIHFFRIEADLTIKQLAEAVGVTRACVHQWESGSHPTVANIYKLASALEVSPRQLIGDGVSSGA